ncbi:MAG: bifunctional hydroxymethylpyrimidine kinase/phosphomethylpyrimidine kinase [Solirubrobacteraceae bacterium]
MLRSALAIAGSDSGGGAGIQADLKAFARCGVHGTTAITAVTAQNTVGVEAILAVPPETILAQVRAVTRDIRIDAVKVGMLGSSQTVSAVAQALAELPAATPVVVDPVMVAESGASLLDADARRALIELVLPRADVITPNLPEARALLAGAEPQGGSGLRGPDGEPDEQDQEVEDLARALLALGPHAVVITGGHRRRASDVLVQADDGAATQIAGERHRAGASHGSGCTHSSVLAAHLALGSTTLQAARAARALAGEAVRDGLSEVGAGAGPVDVLGIAQRRSREAG